MMCSPAQAFLKDIGLLCKQPGSLEFKTATSGDNATTQLVAFQQKTSELIVPLGPWFFHRHLQTSPLKACKPSDRL